MSIVDRERPPDHLYDWECSDNVCFLCGDPRYEPYRKVDQYGFTFEYKRCQCGLIKQTPMPNEAFFEWFFNSDHFFSAKETQGNKIWGYHDYFADEANRMMTSRWRYRRLRKYYRSERPLEVMKIGPSTGTFLHVAKQHGHEVYGCDISDRFRQFARENYGVDVDIGRYEKQGYEDEAFDRLMLLSVIENVPNLDEFLSEIQRTVKLGGYFIFNYVDMKHNIAAKLQGDRYSLFRPPICYIMDRDVLPKLLARYGFVERDNMADLRIMNLEKIVTLLGWRRLWNMLRALRLHRTPLPVYAYPSRIVVAERVR